MLIKCSIIEHFSGRVRKEEQEMRFEIWPRRAYVRNISSREVYSMSYDTQK